MFLRFLVALMLLNGCSSTAGAGETGPQGPPGPAGPAGADGKSPAPYCTPGQAFCDSAGLWTCTRSGSDATGGACNPGTVTNPVVCATTHCPVGVAACCRPSKPVCTWAFTGATTLGQGAMYVATDGPGYCAAPSNCTQAVFSATLVPREFAPACPPSFDYLTISFTRASLTPGQPVAFPTPKVSVVYSEGGVSCGAWTGSFTWDSEVPSWRVHMSLTCSEVGKSSLTFSGSFSGEL